MGRYSFQQHMQIIKNSYQNGCSFRAMYHVLLPFYDHHNCDTGSTVRNALNKFNAATVNHQPAAVCRRNARAARNNIAVPNWRIRSSRYCIIEFDISQTITWLILCHNLWLQLHKIQLTQEFGLAALSVHISLKTSWPTHHCQQQVL